MTDRELVEKLKKALEDIELLKAQVVTGSMLGKAVVQFSSW